MMPDDPNDERISKLMASVRADADPALWTRVRARIEARERDRARGWLGWAMRPAALGASFAMLGVSLVAAAALVVTAPRATSTSTSLEEALVTELENSGSVTPGSVAATPGAATDSGAAK